MGEFNSDDHYLYYCGQESLRRNGVALIINKRSEMQYLGVSQKLQNDLCLFPRQTIQYHSNSTSFYAPTSNDEEAKRLYNDLQDVLELTPKKDVIFIIGDFLLWSNRQIWLWSTDEAGQRLIEFCQENPLVRENILFHQHKKRFYTWTSPDGQHRNQVDYILCCQRWRTSIESAKKDWELTVAQNMNSLLKELN